MINYDPLNGQAIGYSPVSVSVSQDTIAFDGYGLQNAKIRTLLIDNDDTGRIDLSTFDFPRDDGGGFLTKYYRGRQIQLRINVTSDTADSLNTKIDEIKKNLSKTEGNLDIAIGGETRRIKATVSSIKFDRKNYNITFINGMITFSAVEAFFRAVNDQSWLFEARGADFWEEIGQNGSADADPKFYCIFGMGTAASQLALTCKSRSVTITRSFMPGDILIIDSDNKIINHNGVAVDYSGIFPVFSPGSNPFHITIVGTALLDLTVTAPKNYL